MQEQKTRYKYRTLRVKGDARADRMIEFMEKKGWELADANVRKAHYSLMGGVFTRKQIHTLRFRKAK
jgi:hypothetical protein